MVSDSPNTSSPSTALTALALKVVGIITILAFLLDFVLIVIPPRLSDQAWLLASITQLVERGIVPLVGIALLLAGYWVQSIGTTMPRRPPLWANFRLWSLLLAALLGLFYLIFTVVYPNTIQNSSELALEQLQQQATAAQTELEGRLGQQVQQQRAQIDLLIQNEELLAQAVANGQVPAEQADLIRQFRESPESLEQFLEQQVGAAREQLQLELGTRQEEAKEQVQQEALKSGIRISLSSLLLAIGYFIIAVFGLGALRAGA